MFATPNATARPYIARRRRTSNAATAATALEISDASPTLTRYGPGRCAPRHPDPGSPMGRRRRLRRRGIRRLPSCCRRRVSDLSQTYRHLGHPWTEDEISVRYAAANRRGEQLLGEMPDAAPERPIALLATAIPSVATLSVAIHLLHALSPGVQDKLAGELLDTAETNAADALCRCHRALELDGLTHSYTADEWLPVIYDIAGPLLESSRLDAEPPSLVRHAQEALGWLSTSIACLDEDSRETSAALADTLARLMVLCVFADAARTRSASGAE